MSLYATAAEFSAMNQKAEDLGLVLECSVYSNGACQWGAIFTIKKDGEVVLESNSKALVQTLIDIMHDNAKINCEASLN